MRPLQTFKSKNVVVKIVFNNNLLEVGNTGTSLKSSRHFASIGRSNSRSVVGLLKVKKSKIVLTARFMVRTQWQESKRAGFAFWT